MKKPDVPQVLQAICCLLCVLITARNTFDLAGTEFSGGWLTGPLLSMASIGLLLFVLAFAVTFLCPRVAAAVGVAASLLALPIHFYFIAKLPFAEIFAPGHEFMLQPIAGFHWEKWTTIGLLVLASTCFLCIRCIAVACKVPKPLMRCGVTAHISPTLISALLALLLLAVPLFILKLHDQSVEVPQFAVSVKLSKAAEQRLRSLNESVIVMAQFWGDGKPESAESTRRIDLGTEGEPIDKTNVVEFKDAKVLHDSWKRLSDKNYSVAIYAVSVGKNSDARNILHCSIPVDRIDDVKGKTVELSCSLEEESRKAQAR